MSNTVIGPIRTITNKFAAISAGDADLTQHIKITTHDELGNLSNYFNIFLDKLSLIVENIRKNTKDLANGGHVLSANAQATAAALNEITANITSARTEIGKITKSVNSTHESMQKVNTTITELDNRIQLQFNSIEQSSASVEEMVGNIESVTKLVHSIKIIRNLLQLQKMEKLCWKR